jgi:hypothetical protein
MNDFSTLFPNVAAQCAQLAQVLLPIAFVLLAIGIVSSTITGQRSPGAYLRTIGRTFAFVMVLTQLTTWGNQVSSIVDQTVKETLQADPAAVYAQYQKALETQKGEAQNPQNRSWYDKLFDAQGAFEAIVSSLLYVLGLLASVIVFYAYLLQKFVLYLGYALAPIFVGFLAVRTLSSIGTSYLLGLVGVMLWPLGWGAASIMTQGLIDFMTDQSFLGGGTVAGGAGYTLQNFLGVAALGLWLIFSTIAAPVILQKAVSSGTQIGLALAGGASTAATAGITSGAGAAAAFSSGGGILGGLAGVAGGVGAATAATAGSSISGSSHSPIGNLLSSLAHQRPAKRPKPESDDLSGDRAVRELLRKS